MKSILMRGLGLLLLAFMGNIAVGAEVMKSEEAEVWIAYAIMVKTDAELGHEMLLFNAMYLEECGKRLWPEEVHNHPLFPELQHHVTKKTAITKAFKSGLCVNKLN